MGRCNRNKDTDTANSKTVSICLCECGRESLCVVCLVDRGLWGHDLHVVALRPASPPSYTHTHTSFTQALSGISLAPLLPSGPRGVYTHTHTHTHCLTSATDVPLTSLRRHADGGSRRGDHRRSSGRPGHICPAWLFRGGGLNGTSVETLVATLNRAAPIERPHTGRLPRKITGGNLGSRPFQGS